MHQTRAEFSTKLPFARKGTKYLVRSNSDLKNSVPVLLALREMLGLARTAREAKEILKQKIVKLNGREVKDYHESIRLFNILEAEKSYILTLNKSGKFILEATNAKERLCKVVGKKILKKNQIQINLHDGTNILTNEKIEVSDSIYLDFKNNVTSHIKFEKGKKCFIISGKYLGHKGIIEETKNGRCLVSLNDKKTDLDKKAVIVL